jgi:probable HAF family extracellular repeat protein
MFYIKCFLLHISLLILLIQFTSLPIHAVSIVQVPYIYQYRCEYKNETLETLSFNESYATDINDSGEIVGFCKNLSSYPQKNAFINYPNGQLEIIDIQAIDITSLIINNKSQVAGTCVIKDENNNGKSVGFLWERGKKIKYLPTLGGNNTWVKDINDLGQVVGVSETGIKSDFDKITNVRHAFLWENDKMLDLATLHTSEGLGGDMSEALAINNLSEVIGLSNFAIKIGNEKKKAVSKPFYWNGSMMEIPCGKAPVAINNKSNVVLNDFNQSIIWNPSSNTAYSISHSPAVDINDNDIVIFTTSSLLKPNEPYNEEIPFYANKKLHRGTSFYCMDNNLRCIIIYFSKINNKNQIIGYGLIESLNEPHCCKLTPLNSNGTIGN